MEKNLKGNELIAYKIISEEPGIQTSELARKMHTWTRTARDVARNLIRKGLIKKTGYETRRVLVYGQKSNIRVASYEVIK